MPVLVDRYRRLSRPGSDVDTAASRSVARERRAEEVRRLGRESTEAVR